MKSRHSCPEGGREEDEVDSRDREEEYSEEAHEGGGRLTKCSTALLRGNKLLSPPPIAGDWRFDIAGQGKITKKRRRGGGQGTKQNKTKQKSEVK